MNNLLLELDTDAITKPSFIKLNNSHGQIAMGGIINILTIIKALFSNDYLKEEDIQDIYLEFNECMNEISETLPISTSYDIDRYINKLILKYQRLSVNFEYYETAVNLRIFNSFRLSDGLVGEEDI